MSFFFLPQTFKARSLSLPKINFKLFNMLFRSLHRPIQSFFKLRCSQLSQIYVQEPSTTAFLWFFVHAVVSCLPLRGPFCLFQSFILECASPTLHPSNTGSDDFSAAPFSTVRIHLFLSYTLVYLRDLIKVLTTDCHYEMNYLHLSSLVN